MNRVCETLGIELPIIQAGMSWLNNAELCAAVSNAGGLGILGPNAGQTTVTYDVHETGERMRREIRKVRELTDKPFAVTVMGAANGVDATSEYTIRVLEVAAEEKVPACLINTFSPGASSVGVEDNLIPMAKAAGMKIIVRSWNPTVADAKMVESQGADIYVATGFDEGGTLPPNIIGSFSLLPYIVDAIDIPVCLAGGVCDRRAVNAAFALGAEGVYCGTAMLATKESPVHPKVKQMMVDMTAEDLLIFRCAPAYYRSLPCELGEKLAANDKVMTLEEVQEKNTALMNGTSGLRIAMMNADFENGYISVGTGVSQIHSIRPVKEVIEDFMADYIKGQFSFKK